MLGSGLNLVTTVVGFGMSVTFIVFILARLICGRIRYSESRAATEHAIPSLESVDVAAIPTMKYHREAFRPKGDAQCSICLAEYEDKEMLRIMPACLHNFHLTCIDVWLEMHSTCPICRLPLNSVALQILGAEFTADHTNSRFPPTHQRTGSDPRHHEIDESILVVSGVPHGEHESVA
ncbi:RING-H2 finger protein ATL67 [Platanthera guangdongensis]|uniref:RING-H2 finger protein ATL67 n=1 Tax=Platanthera guangdongensis TaxID=2320717 RepID=A0ABR2LMY4_9ASPA